MTMDMDKYCERKLQFYSNTFSTLDEMDDLSNYKGTTKKTGSRKYLKLKQASNYQ